MTLKLYLWGMRVSVFLSLLAWGAVVCFIDPEKTGIFGQVLFYLTLFLSLSGTFILFLTWARRKARGGEIAFVHLGISFRQGLLLGLLAVLLLVLQHFQVLTWWDGLLVIAGIFLVELYFLSR
ncbi:MAG: hypothetical protein NT136_01955 [Candidatus Moranbacteria bacterium]|nr:hypothetical protein [Candidatus Moranbacteria bacterium]